MKSKVFKMASLILVLSLITVSLISQAATPGFSDLKPTHWCYEKIMDFLDRGYVDGYKDGTFKADQTITRAEYVKIVNNFFGYDSTPKGGSTFKDVPENAWYTGYVEEAVRRGYITGYDDGTFKPQDPIRRQEATVILARIIHIDKEEYPEDHVDGLAQYSDNKEVQAWARQAIHSYSVHNFINGYKDGTLKILKNVTRAETVELLNKLEENIEIERPTGGGGGGTTIYYNVTYYNSGEELTDLKQRVASGKDVTVHEKPVDFMQEGYEFAGWRRQDTNTIYGGGETISKLKSHIRMDAIWATIKVEADPDPNTVESGDPSGDPSGETPVTPSGDNPGDITNEDIEANGLVMWVGEKRKFHVSIIPEDLQATYTYSVIEGTNHENIILEEDGTVTALAETKEPVQVSITATTAQGFEITKVVDVIVLDREITIETPVDPSGDVPTPSGDTPTPTPTPTGDPSGETPTSGEETIDVLANGVTLYVGQEKELSLTLTPDAKNKVVAWEFIDETQTYADFVKGENTENATIKGLAEGETKAKVTVSINGVEVSREIDVKVIQLHITSSVVTDESGDNHGSIAPEGTINADYEKDYTYTFTPDDKYTVKEITVDGTALSTEERDQYKVDGYKFEDVIADHEITVKFGEDQNENNIPDDEEDHFSVTYYSSGDELTDLKQTVVTGLDVVVHEKPADLAIEGFEFAGWKRENGTTIYAGGETISKLSENIRLDAIWATIKVEADPDPNTVEPSGDPSGDTPVDPSGDPSGDTPVVPSGDNSGDITNEDIEANGLVMWVGEKRRFNVSIIPEDLQATYAYEIVEGTNHENITLAEDGTVTALAATKEPVQVAITATTVQGFEITKVVDVIVLDREIEIEVPVDPSGDPTVDPSGDPSGDPTITPSGDETIDALANGVTLYIGEEKEMTLTLRPDAEKKTVVWTLDQEETIAEIVKGSDENEATVRGITSGEVTATVTITIHDVVVVEKEVTVTVLPLEAVIHHVFDDEAVTVEDNKVIIDSVDKTVAVADYVYSGEEASWYTITKDVETLNKDVLEATISYTRKSTSYTVNYLEKDKPTVTVADAKTVTDVKVGDMISGESEKLEEAPGFTYDSVDPEELVLADSDNVINVYYTRNSYTVEYEYTGEVIPKDATALPASGEYLFDETVIVAGPAEAAGYTFSGWSRTENFPMPAENVTITGSFSAKDDTAYTVEYYKQNVEKTAFEKDDDATVNETGTTGAVVEAEQKEFEGFTFDETNTNNVVSGEIAGDGSLVLKLYYVRNSYTVEYEYTGEVIPADATALPASGEYAYGATVTVADPATAAGYEFSGWDRTGTFPMPAENVTITGSFSAKDDTPYQVKHYTEKLNGTFEIKQTENLTGTTGAVVEAEQKEFEGFTFDPNNANNIVSGEIAGDGSLVLKLYYTLNSYTVTWQNYNGTQLEVDENVKHGTTPSYDSGEPTRPSDSTYKYEFAGWTKNGASVTIANEVVTGDVTYVASYNRKEKATLSATINSDYPKADGTKAEPGDTIKYTVSFEEIGGETSGEYPMTVCLSISGATRSGDSIDHVASTIANLPEGAVYDSDSGTITYTINSVDDTLTFDLTVSNMVPAGATLTVEATEGATGTSSVAIEDSVILKQESNKNIVLLLDTSGSMTFCLKHGSGDLDCDASGWDWDTGKYDSDKYDIYCTECGKAHVTRSWGGMLTGWTYSCSEHGSLGGTSYCKQCGLLYSSRLSALKTAAKAFAKSILENKGASENITITFIQFASDVTISDTKTNPSYSAVETAINAIEVAGGTDINQALANATAVFSGDKGDRMLDNATNILVFLSDGEPDAKKEISDSTLRDFRKFEIESFAVGLGDSFATGEMNKIVNNNQLRIFPATNEEGLVKAFEEIASEINSMQSDHGYIGTTLTDTENIYPITLTYKDVSGDTVTITVSNSSQLAENHIAIDEENNISWDISNYPGCSAFTMELGTSAGTRGLRKALMTKTMDSDEFTWTVVYVGKDNTGDLSEEELLAIENALAEPDEKEEIISEDSDEIEMIESGEKVEAEEVVESEEKVEEKKDKDEKEAEEVTKPSEDDKKEEEEVTKPSEDDKKEEEEVIKPSEDDKKEEEEVIKPSEDDKKEEEEVIKPSEDDKKEEEEISVEEPKASEKEVSVEEPKASEEEVPVEEPKASEEEVPVEEPKASEEEVPVEEPKASEEEIPVEEPKTIEEKSSVEETESTKQVEAVLPQETENTKQDDEQEAA